METWTYLAGGIGLIGLGVANLRMGTGATGAEVMAHLTDAYQTGSRDSWVNAGLATVSLVTKVKLANKLREVPYLKDLTDDQIRGLAAMIIAMVSSEVQNPDANADPTHPTMQDLGYAHDPDTEQNRHRGLGAGLRRYDVLNVKEQ